VYMMILLVTLNQSQCQRDRNNWRRRQSHERVSEDELIKEAMNANAIRD
jgi:hypothetical protein